LTNNNIIGTFTITHSSIKLPKKEDITVIEKAAHLVAIAIERFKADQMIQQQANYDPLTDYLIAICSGKSLPRS
jgi:GAF domain-containing protein